MRQSVAILLLGLVALSTALGQNTLLVPSVLYPTIQSAINVSSAGDVIQVAAGTYVENVVWPAFDIHLLGAGPGQSIIDGNQSGSCVLITTGVSNASILEGFTLTNGSGSPAFAGGFSMLPLGGGIHLNGNQVSSAVGVKPIIRNCEIVGNTANDGGGALVRFAGPTFEDCVFANNTAYLSVNPAYGPGAAGVMVETNDKVTFLRCVFKQHVGYPACRFGANWTPDIEIVDCSFTQNSGASVLLMHGETVRIIRTQFTDNTGGVLGITQVGFPAPLEIQGCLFARNTSPYGAIGFAVSPVSPPALLSNCSFIGNHTGTTGTPGSKTLGLNAPTLMTDCLMRGNRGPTGGFLANPIAMPNGSAGIIIQNSNIQGQAGLGPGGVNVNPQFVDGPNGDYRLKPGSPMIDAGTQNPSYTLPATDIRGLPRVRGGRVDIGAYESQAMAHHPASAGRVGENSGGPFDILTVNASSGGLFRRVEVPIGTSSSLEMAQPPYLSGPVQFAIYGILGEANFDSVTNVPLGIGDMMFAPAPMIPYLHPSFFMLVSTFGPIGPWQPLFSATPTPWSSGPGPAIPFPFLMTIQGIIEEAPGVYVPTNALIFEVK